MLSACGVILALFLSCITGAADNVLKVDDSDTRIAYSKNSWTHQDGTCQYNNTVSLCRVLGGTASFSFVGTHISVFGTRGPTGVYQENSSYVVDDGVPAFWTNASDILSVECQVQFYASPQLPESEHTLVITNFGDWLWLDFLEVTVADTGMGPPISVITSSTSQRSSTPGHPFASSSSIPTASSIGTASISSSVTSTTVSAAHFTKPVNKRVIGGVAALGVFLVLLITGICIWRFLKKRRQEAPVVEPFAAPTPLSVSTGAAALLISDASPYTPPAAPFRHAEPADKSPQVFESYPYGPPPATIHAPPSTNPPSVLAAAGPEPLVSRRYPHSIPPQSLTTSPSVYPSPSVRTTTWMSGLDNTGRSYAFALAEGGGRTAGAAARSRVEKELASSPPAYSQYP
ncbi:hypothetical protein OBBRIDRAFT_204098 [Obba rivulosa]|uniref:Uncharacterized protein n=1 Tax=Obba rivulosa TaxID=1052685 RepID=A0A8E2ALF1_9APHY|nr:hypothetical protein OBBRIDRAFT_204098 [Obba rivulosa]